MNVLKTCLALLIFAAIIGIQVQAQPDAETRNPSHATLETVALVDLLETLQDASGRSFLVDHRVDPNVVTGQLDTANMTYSDLLHVLRNNGLAAVNANNLVTIVPAGIVRQFPLPVIDEEDDSIHDEEWVTWMVFVDNADATTLVPILRPMMPAEGHLAANPPSSGIVVVDRYGNAKRIVSLIREMDGATRRP